jgi:hypothetical protein
VDNRRYKAAGFNYKHTSRETVEKLGEYLRLHPVVRGAQEPYRYEREVEDFLRWSPHVKNTRDKAASELSRDQLAELQRLLTSFADTTGMDLSDDAPDRAAEAERRATAAEQAARTAAESAAGAEERVRKADERAREAQDSAREAQEHAREQAETARAEAEERAKAARSRPARAPRPRRSRRPVEHYDDLAQEEVIALLGSLDEPDLETLAEYERDHAKRPRVISAIESVLARR